MSETPKDGAAVRFPPPFVPLIALAIAIAIHAFVWPLSIPISGIARWSLAGGLLAVGLALMAGAIGPFRRTGQDPKPWEATPEVISTGVYGFTRNPMYLSMGILQAGLGVALANAWALIGVPVTWLAIYAIAIRHEEAYLAGKFGAAYAEYRSSVRRWL